MRIHPLIYIAMVFQTACLTEPPGSPSETARVVEAGWSFGFCLGPCRGSLQIEGVTLTYRISDRAGEQVLATNRGSLTSRGRATLDALGGALPESLQSTYGCPDCADAGAAYVVVERSSASRRSDYEYPNPPSELTAIDAFLRGVMDALGTCQSTNDVVVDPSCRPTP